MKNRKIIWLAALGLTGLGAASLAAVLTATGVLFPGGVPLGNFSRHSFGMIGSGFHGGGMLGVLVLGFTAAWIGYRLLLDKAGTSPLTDLDGAYARGELDREIWLERRGVLKEEEK